VYLAVKDVHVFSRAAEEALLFEPVDDRVARQHVNTEKTLHLRPGQLKAGHFAVLGLHKLDESIHPWFQRHHTWHVSKPYAGQNGESVRKTLYQFDAPAGISRVTGEFPMRL
jgi:hypothetical protein